MAVSSPVKWFHSGQPNAPATAHAVGGIVGVLDACLAQGFGLTNVTSITVSDGVATVVTATQHSFTYAGQVALVAGVTDKTGLNGEQRVTQIVSSTSYKFETEESDGTASGTVTQTVAPLGWQILFTGTNKRAYKPTAPLATGGILRVDDSALSNGMARVNGFMAMSDVDTGTEGFPTLATNIGWPHRASDWIVIGDDRGFYWLNHNTGNNNGYYCAWFGDILSYKPADAYCSLLTGATTDMMVSGTPIASCLMCAEPALTNVAGYMARAVHQLGSFTTAYRTVPGFLATVLSFIGGVGTAWPDPSNNAMHSSKMIVSNPWHFRGEMPGMVPPLNNIGFALSTISDFIPGQGALAGRMLMPVHGGSYAGTTNQGLNFFDITGPWR